MGKLTTNEKASQQDLKQRKPLVYEKCLRFDDQLAAGQSIALIQLQYAYTCNFHCTFCSVSTFRYKRDHGKTLRVADVKNIFDQADAYGLAHMGISGGEPLVFKSLPEIIEAIGPERFHIQLDTNGWLATPENMHRMKSLGIDKVQVSIESAIPAEHDRMMDKLGSYAHCMAAIDAVLEAGLQLQVATVVGHERAQSKEFEDFMKLMHSKCAPVSVIYAKPVGEYADRFDLMCTPEDIAHVKKLLREYGGYDHSTPGYGRDLGCTAVKRVISITAYGDVLPCPWMYYSLGNVFTTPLADILAKGMRYFGPRSPVCRLSEDREYNEKYTRQLVGREDLPVPIEEIMGVK